MPLEFNLDDMTLGEIETVEELADCCIDDLFAGGKPRGKALRALVFVAQRRTNPNYDYAETANVRQSDFDITNDDKGKDSAVSI